MWGRSGLRRVHIKRFRYSSNVCDTDEYIETQFTVYMEFQQGKKPLLTVKEVDMVTKDPQWECMMVSYALSRIGVHVDSKPSPLSNPRHFMTLDGPSSMPTSWMPCDCLN